VQHLEQQLEQQQHHIRLLAQLQTETEGHVVDLRQQNAQMTQELAGAARGAAELELRARDMRQEQQRLLLALATEERLKEAAQAEAHLSRERLSHESERVAGLEERGDAAGRERSSLAAEKAALLAKVSNVLCLMPYAYALCMRSLAAEKAALLATFSADLLQSCRILEVKHGMALTKPLACNATGVAAQGAPAHVALPTNACSAAANAAASY
jgi:hypothetical protein